MNDDTSNQKILLISKGINIEEIFKFENYLQIAHELMLLNFEFLYKSFKYVFKNINDEWSGNFQNDYYSFVTYFLNIYITNKERLKEILKQAYWRIKIIYKVEPSIAMEILKLLFEYQTGKDEGRYKDLKSFNKILEEHDILLDDFKEVYHNFISIRNAFDKKINKKPKILR
jgi:hypothetical protein